MPFNAFFISQIMIFFLISSPFCYSIDFNYPAVFNFGDSNSDTGGLVAGLGEHLDPPNGLAYFKNPSGRFCDGRLIVDFLSMFSSRHWNFLITCSMSFNFCSKNDWSPVFSVLFRDCLIPCLFSHSFRA